MIDSISKLFINMSARIRRFVCKVDLEMGSMLKFDIFLLGVTNPVVDHLVTIIPEL